MVCTPSYDLISIQLYKLALVCANFYYIFLINLAPNIYDYNLYFSSFRNCLIGQGYNVKISDFAMFRSPYSTDYFKISEDINEIPSSNSMVSQSFQGDLIPLRWIPWEVYIMVSNVVFLVIKYIYTTNYCSK